MKAQHDEPQLRYVEAERRQDTTQLTIQVDDGGFRLVFRDRASLFEITHMLEAGAKFFRDKAETLSQRKREMMIEAFRDVEKLPNAR